MVFRDKSGYQFEVHFHTEQSLKIKEVNHRMYEEYRLAGTSQSRRDELAKKMISNSNSIETPAGIGAID